MTEYISSAIIPLLICVIVGYGLLKKAPVFDYFLEGAKEGIETSFRILPALSGLVIAVSMLRASGFIDFLGELLSPFLTFLHFPKELLPLALMRPISGSGALAVFSDILQKYGADSFVGKSGFYGNYLLYYCRIFRKYRNKKYPLYLKICFIS